MIKRFYTAFTIYIMVMLYTPPVYSINFFFSHLGVEDGLSQVSVLDIFQDSDGYIWFGTRNGANRYDGYEFVVYQNEVNNNATLTDNYIRGFAEDNRKNIWIATSNGINCIDYKTKKITRFYPKSINKECTTNIINRLLKHSDGNVYAFCNRSVFKCSMNQTVETVFPDIAIPSPTYSVAQAPDKDIYIGTESNGLYIYSENWKLKKHVPIDGIIATILPDNNGDIWLGLDETGICLFNKNKQTFTWLHKDNTNLNNNSIRTFVSYGDSSILVGTFRGLNILNKKELTITPANINIAGKGGLSHYSIHSMLIDKDQTLWIGTYSAGVNYHSPFYRPVSYITPNEYAGIIGKGQQDKDGNMWFATEGAGLFYYNPENGRQQLYPIKPLHEGNYEINIIKSILIQGDSILCSTHFGSVYLFSIRDKQYKKLYDFQHNDIFSLYIDKSKRLWIPTNSSQNLVMVDKGKQTNRFMANGISRSFKWVTVIHELEPELFLFGTLSDSLYLYDMKKETVRNLSTELQPDPKFEKLGNITAITQDNEGYVWIATNKNGLYRLNRNLKLAKHNQKKDGLSDSYINSLTIDQHQNIWVTTGKSIYKLNRTTDTFSEMKIADTPAMEFTRFSGNSISADGSIYFPGDKGVLFFNPDKIMVNPNIPPVDITSLIVNNKDDVTGNIEDGEITLTSDQNNITFRYTALNFIHSERNQYAYKLEGADPAWHMVGNRREAYYSNLAPGTYTFRIKASNNDNIWNPEEATLRITIDPPFYKTWWAYLLYFCIITFIMVRIIRHQHDKHERERELRYKQMEQDKVNELHEERMRMFTNFSHELRTPLTLIINPLNDLMQYVSFSPEIKETLQLIKKNTGRMLLLVNNLMDIQKYEAGKTVLQKTSFNFSSFIREMYHSFESVADNREIRFVLDNELPETYKVCFDEAEIEKVFFNLLSNAFKFTPSEGQVTIRVNTVTQAECELLPHFPAQYSSILVEAGYLFIEVIDTGKGFSEQEAEKIFEPFYRSQEDIHRQISGTGIGLSLTRSIILQHNGCIWTESSETEGTRFMFLLPDTEKQEEGENESPVLSKSAEISKKFDLLVEETQNKNKQTVLLADDNQEVLQYLEQQLSLDYIVVKAFNGKEALAMIEESYPHIVISDIMMPEMNGLELCKRIKENQNYCHIPVILLTAKSMISQIEEGLDAGADDYIVKPFQISLLKARIRNLLSLREKMKTMYGETFSLKQFGVEEPKEHDDFLTRYIEIVKANISNPELDVSVIYEALGMSRTNFYRKVKTVTGLSPIELIKNIRLEAGAKLLKESDMNISEIAQHIGFSSRSYFARSFKAVYGMSPTEYQETKSQD